MKSEDFKDIVTNWRGWAGLLLALAQNFLSKEADIDDTDDMAMLVNHWESEKFVEHEKLAGIQNGGFRRNSDDATDHNFAQGTFERRGQQTSRGQHADETFIGIDCEKIDHALADAFTPDAIKRFGHRHVRIQERGIFARVFAYRGVEIRMYNDLRHS